MTQLNIALIGGRGSGKSSVARLLARKLRRPLYVMDDLIVYELSGQSIPEVVQQKGWKFFRDVEYLVATKLGSFSGIIIDCGGGVICDQDEHNVQSYSERKVAALKKNSTIFFLDCPIEEQLKRMGEDPNRPSLTGKKSAREEMEEIMKLRRPWYEKAADYVINSENLSLEESINKIIAIANKA